MLDQHLASLMIGGGLILAMSSFAAHAQEHSTFVDLGEPVRRNALYNHVLGVDADGNERYYQCFRGDPWFLLSFDLKTGASKEYIAHGHKGNPWGALWASNGKLYVSTGGGGTDDLFAFDPATEQIEYLGRPTDSQIVVWTLTEADDGRIYGGTYPNAKLISLDLQTHELMDHGTIAPDQKYIRTVTAQGSYVYCNAGPAKPATWAYDTRTGETTQLIPEEHRSNSRRWGTAERRADGNIYMNPADDVYFRIDGVNIVRVDAMPDAIAEASQGNPDNMVLHTADGTRIDVDDLTGPEQRFFLTSTQGETRTVSFEYTGTATTLWAVEDAPDGTVYGTTRSPITLFAVDPQTDASRVLGDPSGVRGQVYGWHWVDRQLYMATYGGSRLTVWNADEPWVSIGSEASNPRYLGNHKIGRPSVMCLAPDNRHLLISGVPGYGATGGVLTIYDTQTGAFDILEGVVGEQSIYAAATVPGTDLVCLGTTYRGGSASETETSDPRFLLFDVAKRSVVFETVAATGEDAVVQMIEHDGLIYATTGDEGRLVVFDPKARAIIHTTSLGYGPGKLFGLRHYAGDNMIYALSGTSIIRIDPQSYAIEHLGEHPDITAGMAIANDAVYVCAGTHLLKLPIR